MSIWKKVTLRCDFLLWKRCGAIFVVALVHVFISHSVKCYAVEAINLIVILYHIFHLFTTFNAACRSHTLVFLGCGQIWMLIGSEKWYMEWFSLLCVRHNDWCVYVYMVHNFILRNENNTSTKKKCTKKVERKWLHLRNKMKLIALEWTLRKTFGSKQICNMQNIGHYYSLMECIRSNSHGKRCANDSHTHTRSISTVLNQKSNAHLSFTAATKEWYLLKHPQKRIRGEIYIYNI